MSARTVNDWALAEMASQRLVEGASPDAHAWSGYFCLASGCVEDKTDSHGECINCGEPVIVVHAGRVTEAGEG